MTPTPLQQIVVPNDDLLFQHMRHAYQGDSERWRAVTRSLRDAMVDYAVRRSAYYRRIITPGRPFEEIPVLTKTMVREHLEELLAEGVPEDRRVPERTSGSTGEPLEFYRDSAQQLAHRGASDRFIRWLHGVPFDATVVTVTGAGQGDRFSLWRHRLQRVRSRFDPRTPPDPWLHAVHLMELRPDGLEAELRIWSRFRRYYLVGHASGIDWIAEQIERSALAIPRHPVGICTTSDMLTEHARQRIERVFQRPVHSRYGSIEFRWLAPTLPGTVDRYLFNPLLAYCEILDDEGRPVPPGETGRIVLTDLNNYVMPLIRYDNDDLGVASPEGYVGGFRLVDGIIGRSSELLRFPSGKAISGATIAGALFIRNRFARWVRFYQCAQTGPNDLELRVVWNEPPGDGVRAGMAGALQGIVDPDTVVRVADVDDVDRLPSGKVWIARREF